MSARIIVDDLIKWPTKIATFKAGSCHMSIEPDEHDQFDIEALHAFAASIGLKRAWFQGWEKGWPHYDLNASKRRLAVTMGAVEVPWREAAKDRMAWRKRNPSA